MFGAKLYTRYMGFFNDLLSNIPGLSELNDTKDQVVEAVSPATDAVNEIKDSVTNVTDGLGEQVSGVADQVNQAKDDILGNK